MEKWMDGNELMGRWGINDYTLMARVMEGLLVFDPETFLAIERMPAETGKFCQYGNTAKTTFAFRTIGEVRALLPKLIFALTDVEAFEQKQPSVATTSKGKVVKGRRAIARRLGVSVAALQKTLEPDGFPMHTGPRREKWSYENEITEWAQEHQDQIINLKERRKLGKA